MRAEADEIVTALDPIYTGISHGSEYEEAVKHRENVAKYNRDTAKIIDRCWNCSHFGLEIASQDRRHNTRCRKCREAMLKAIELKEKK